jgi:hypothetical protein
MEFDEPRYYADTDLGQVITDDDSFSASGRFWRDGDWEKGGNNSQLGHFPATTIEELVKRDYATDYAIPRVGISFIDMHRIGAQIIDDEAEWVFSTKVTLPWTAGAVIDWDYSWNPETRVLTVNFSDGTNSHTITSEAQPLPDDRHFTFSAFGMHDARKSNPAVTEPVYKGDVFFDTVSYTGLTYEQARNPLPEHRAEGVLPDVVLGWDAGVSAASHDVYFGTVKGYVAAADHAWDEFRGNQTEASYDRYVLRPGHACSGHKVLLAHRRGRRRRNRLARRRLEFLGGRLHHDRRLRGHLRVGGFRFGHRLRLQFDRRLSRRLQIDGGPVPELNPL